MRKKEMGFESAVLRLLLMLSTRNILPSLGLISQMGTVKGILFGSPNFESPTSHKSPSVETNSEEQRAVGSITYSK